MLSEVLCDLADPELVARFQKFCGVELVPDHGDGRSGVGMVNEFGPHSAVLTESAGKGDDKHRCNNNGDGDTTVLTATRRPATCVANCVNGDTTLTYTSRIQSHGTNVNNLNNNNNNTKDSSDSVMPNGTADGGIISECGESVAVNGIDRHNSLAAPATAVSPAVYFHDRCSNIYADRSATAATSAFTPACRSRGPGDPIEGSSAVTTTTHYHGTGKTATRVVIRYPFLYYCARVGAFLGNEEFYLTGLPFVLWAVDSAMLRQVGVLWALVMYLGQATKDYLCWRRPSSPPVVRLETEHLAEFATPSTHAMAGTAIPMLLASLLSERYEIPGLPLVCLALVWLTITCFSRLYLGVHSVLDLVVGVVFALVIYVSFSPLIVKYDLYQQTHSLSPLILVSTSLALCTICYPSNKGAARVAAIIITASVAGLGVGAWLNYQLGYSQLVPITPHRLPVKPLTLSWLASSLMQFLVGVGVVVMIKVMVKRVAVAAFCAMLGVDRQDTEHPMVMVGSKFITYLAIGFSIAFISPLLFAFLGFGRPAYYLEVL